MDYEAMSVEELNTLVADLSRDREVITVKIREIVQIRDAKLLLEETNRRVALMSDPEKQALLQVLAPQGIESVEEVGTPGAGGNIFKRLWPFS